MFENQKKAATKTAVTGHNAGRRSVSSICTLLYKDNKLRTLSKAEKARLLMLEDCLEELTANQSVSDLRLKRVLLEQEYTRYKDEYNGIREQQKELKEKPDEIIKYEKMLKRASFYCNRGEFFSSRSKHKTAQKFLSKADMCFEKLYEYLQEITAKDITIWQYFDRTVTFDIENMPSLTPDYAPRVINSKSHYNQIKKSFTTRNDCKISAVERAILNLKYVINKEEESDEKSVKSRKLKEILYANNENLY